MPKKIFIIDLTNKNNSLDELPLQLEEYKVKLLTSAGQEQFYKDKYDQLLDVITFSDLNFIGAGGDNPQIREVAKFINNNNYERLVIIGDKYLKQYMFLWKYLDIPLEVCSPNGYIRKIGLSDYLREVIKYIKDKIIIPSLKKVLTPLLFVLNIFFYSLYYIINLFLNLSINPDNLMSPQDFIGFLGVVFEDKPSTDKQKQAFKNYSTAFLRKYPDCIFAGVEKCGTTTFRNYINFHPRIHHPEVRDTRYFQKKYKKYGDYWYRSLFPLESKLIFGSVTSGKNNLCLETSPFLYNRPKTPRRINKSTPDSKIIMILRNPVKRAYSHYHDKKNWKYKKFESILGKPDFSFKELIDYELENLPRPTAIDSIDDLPRFTSKCLKLGFYCLYLKNWFKYFTPEQILILKSENIFEKPVNTLNRVSDFLNIDKFTLRRGKFHRNKGDYHAMNERDKEVLGKLYEPFNEELYEMIDRDFNWGNEL